MLSHVLLALDGSDSSRRAVAFVRRLLGDGAGPDLTLLVVLEPPSLAPFAPLEGTAVLTAPHPSPDHIAAARAMIGALTTELGAGRVHERVEVGHPADVICRVADEIDADLIILGARGRNPALQWLLGSVSERVVRHATRPVTVIR